MPRTLLLLALLGPWAAAAQVPAASELDARIEALRVAYQTPGVAVAVVQDGEVAYARGFGHRDLERRLPVTTETAFPVGSVTKAFTASLVGLYAHDGRLALTDRPARHLPALRFRTASMDELVTIEDLMVHESGIGNIDGAMVHFPDTTRQTLRIGRLAHLEPATAVRERLAYSNGGYALLGAVIEQISGRSWGDEVQDRLFAPLGMGRSGTSIDALSATANAAVGYGMVGGAPERLLYEDLHESSPGGAIHSTALDLARWVAMLLAHGQHDGDQILPADLVTRAFSIHSVWRPTYDPEAGELDLLAYGHGWFLDTFEGRFQVSHGGSVSGFTARVALLPSEGLGVVVLTNQHLSGLPNWVAETVYRHVLGLPPRETASFPVDVGEVAPIVRDSASVSFRDLNPESPPTHPLERYTGAYAHPGFGTFTVALRGGALYADFPTLSFALEHEQANVFRLRRTYEIHVNTPDFPVRFDLGVDGSVTGASIPFQAEPVTFARDLDGLRVERP
ncbi:MAG: serine hydrolase [Bacteroidota bacterium]